MQKTIKNGKVAVLISRGLGAGWYSWHKKLELVFHPYIVKLVEEGRRGEITEELLEQLTGDEYVTALGASGLEIVWLPVGTQFYIEEYDGAESIRTANDFFTA